MRVTGTESIDVVLRAPRRVAGDGRADASDRPAVRCEAVLRQPADGTDVRHQPGACSTFDAVAGSGGDLPEAASFATWDRPPDLPVFAAKRGDCASGSSLVERHHVRAHAAGVDVLDGGDGLVQPVRAFVAAVEHAGRPVLPGGVGGSVVAGTTGGLQHGPGRAVHGRGVHRTIAGSGRVGEHGWAWPVAGQRVRRAALADGQAGARVPARSWDAARLGKWPAKVLRVLQPRADSHVARLPHTSSGVPIATRCGMNAAGVLSKFNRAKEIGKSTCTQCEGEGMRPREAWEGPRGTLTPPPKKP